MMENEKCKINENWYNFIKKAVNENDGCSNGNREFDKRKC